MAHIRRRTTADGSYRYDVRYRTPAGRVVTRTFRRARDANDHVTTVESARLRGALIDPRAGRVTLDEWSKTWLANRPDLRPRTADLYSGLLRLHIKPILGSLEVAKIDTATVRHWHAAMVKAHEEGSLVPAKAYRLLRTILNTAVQDGLIAANPCKLRGAGVERSAERPTVSPAQIWALADAMPRNHRLMVLLAGFCGLRLGELLGLQVADINVVQRTIRVERQLQQVGPRGEQRTTEPKSAAGRRVLALPRTLRPEVERHLAAWPGSDDGWLFLGQHGGPLRRGVFQGEWSKARRAANLEQIRFHDLRHSALTLLAATGATVAELQAHAGHASPQAALRYQHATEGRARELADLVDRVIGEREVGHGSQLSTARAAAQSSP